MMFQLFLPQEDVGSIKLQKHVKIMGIAHRSQYSNVKSILPNGVF